MSGQFTDWSIDRARTIAGKEGARPVKIAEFIEGQTLKEWLAKATETERQAAFERLSDNFVADALLGNWDVIGLEMDNILVTWNGDFYRIDNGGGLRFRAQGGKKTAQQWNGKVTELTSLLDPRVNANTAEVFAGVTQAQIHSAIRKSVDRRQALLAAMPAEVAGVLEKRIDFLEKRLQLAATGDAELVFNGSSELKSTLNSVGWTKGDPGYWKQHQEKDFGEPALPKAQRVSSGVVVVEPDGRVWLFEPTGHFAGVRNTFSKGKLERGLSLQQNALKEAMEELGLEVELTGYLGDYQRGTSMSRMYLGKRTGGRPIDAGWESQFVKLATPDQARAILDQAADQKILDAIQSILAPGSVIKQAAKKAAVVAGSRQKILDGFADAVIQAKGKGTLSASISVRLKTSRCSSGARRTRGGRRSPGPG